MTLYLYTTNFSYNNYYDRFDSITTKSKLKQLDVMSIGKLNTLQQRFTENSDGR